jgi:Na+/glutamate symporter
MHLLTATPFTLAAIKMPTKSIRLYHLFLLLVPINIAAFYAFVGSSQLQSSNSKDINYLIATSATIVAIWFAYHLLRHKLTSKRMLWAHLCFITICVLIVPSLTTAFVPTPRRYLDFNSDGFKLSDIFDSMTTAVVVQLTLFALSLAFLIFNVRGNRRAAISDLSEAI